jgi:hypothetical protein
MKARRGQPVKQPEGPANARLSLRLPEATKAKIMRNGGTEWLVKVVREAEEKSNGTV